MLVEALTVVAVFGLGVINEFENKKLSTWNQRQTRSSRKLGEDEKKKARGNITRSMWKLSFR